MTTTRIAAARGAATAALILAGFFGASTPAFAGPFDSGSAAPATSGKLGPFEYEHQCLERGNEGMKNGEWPDYDCVGSYGAWYIQPHN